MLALTETKVLQGSPALQHCTPPTHQVFHAARASASRGGGVALIAARKLACKKYIYPHKVSSFEHLIVHFAGVHKPCFIINIYRPPSGNVTTFIEEFSSLIEYMSNPNRELIVLGDFNIHVNDSADPSASRFLGALNDLSLQNHVWSPTYRHSEHTLDLVIGSYIDPIVSRVDVCSASSFSDHSLITFDLDCPPFYSKVEKRIEFRLYNEVESFRDRVREILRTIEPSSETELSATMNEALVSQRDKFFPLLSKIITLCASSPWFDGSCKLAKARCRRFERRFRKYPSETTRSAYLSALGEYNASLHSVKSVYYTSLFENLRGDPRKLYATVSILKGKSPDRTLPDLSRTDPLLLAFQFNYYLFEKISRIRVELDGTPIDVTVPPLPMEVGSMLSEFQQVTFDQFEEIYNRCNITSCPLDPVDYRKLSPDFLKPFFLDVINSTFASSIFQRPRNAESFSRY